MAGCVRKIKLLFRVRSQKFLFAVIVMAFILFGKRFYWMLRTTNITLDEMLNHERHASSLNREKLADEEVDSNVKVSTCVFPDVNVYEPSVVAVAGLNLTTLQCEGTYLPDLTYTQDITIIVNTSKVQQYHGNSTFQHCKYRHIWRNDSDDNSYIYSDWSDPFTDKIQLPRNSEFVRVQCWNIRSELVSNTYLCLVPRKEEFDGLYFANLKKREVESAPKETLNVVMIVMDSLQRNQLIRGCNETYGYLMNTLKSFDLTMHSQLGDNTFPNFLPIFTGNFRHETKKWWNMSLPMDTFDMIWYAFEKAGYRTAYTESSDWGAFNWQRKGFIQPFSRYYPRPFHLALNDDGSLDEVSRFCAGNQLHLNVRLNYIGRLLDVFPNKPVFAVGMMSKETHNDQTYAKYFDEHLLNFYKWMRAKGHLNRTLVVTLSDHGTRWGKLRDSVNGHFESRTPFTILTFPEWFVTKYPDVAENLRINTKRLTSHFDTHATLLDLLYFKSDYPPPLPRNRYGLSLLKEIPWNRTCKEASIPAEFCMCGYKEVEDIDIHSELSTKLSHLLVKTINQRTEATHVCAEYTLTHVMRVIKITFEGSDINKQQADDLYKVTVQAAPGGAIFEAYIEIKGTPSVSTVGYFIFRLNSYKGQSDCVKHPLFKPMCYCKNLLPQAG